MKSNLENDGQHINEILQTTPCGKHNATEGTACWYVFITYSKRFAPAVCGKRIKRAGFNGSISAGSLSLRAPGGRKPPKRSSNAA
jgi:hypothetical protein